MKVLHINVAGICDKFYDVFFENLRNAGDINQVIYIPYKANDYKDRDLNRFNNYHENVKVILSPIKKKKDRIMYFSKIKKYFLDVERKVRDINSIDVIHAHSLFSDGGVAYYLYKKYGIPYIVSVRVTDINIFLRYFFHLRPFMMKILLNASNVIFLNPNLKENLFSSISDKLLKKKIDPKSKIIPNGINNFWLNNSYYKETNLLPKLNIIQVGRLNENKNPKTTLYAVSELVKRGYDVKADFVGEGSQLNQLEGLVKGLGIQNNVIFHGFIEDKEILMNFYRQANFFVLPSYSETLGIAYIEAMSQGLPVIYSKGQGIDGYFEDGEVGFPINPSSAGEICDAILNLQDNYDEISKRCTNYALSFNWDNISAKYISVYKNALGI